MGINIEWSGNIIMWVPLTGGKPLSVPFSRTLQQYVWRNVNYCRGFMGIIRISHYAASWGNCRWDAKQVRVSYSSVSFFLVFPCICFVLPSTCSTFSPASFHLLAFFWVTFSFLLNLWLPPALCLLPSLPPPPALPPSLPQAQWIRGF